MGPHDKALVDGTLWETILGHGSGLVSRLLHPEPLPSIPGMAAKRARGAASPDRSPSLSEEQGRHLVVFFFFLVQSKYSNSGVSEEAHGCILH